MDRYYRRSPAVASRVVDGEAVLVKMPERMLYVLNRSASMIWAGADGTVPGCELAPSVPRQLVRPGRGPTYRPRQGLAGFLDEMVRLGLFERADSPCDAPDAFPQEVTWPDTDEPEPAAVLASERVEAMAGVCSAETVEEFFCPTIF